MATPRSLISYPAELTALLRRALSAPQTIRFTSPREARAARGRIYSFRRALANAEGYVSGYEDLMLMVPLARMRIEGANLTIAYEELANGYDTPADDPYLRDSEVPEAS